MPKTVATKTGIWIKRETMIAREKNQSVESATDYLDNPAEARPNPREFQKNKSAGTAPKTIESQLSEMTVSSELSNLNKSYSFASQISSDDFEEIQKLRKIEFMKMPVHMRIVARAKEAIEIILAFFTGKRQNNKNKHMTATAKKAIIQLRQIAALYSAMPQRSLEETIVFDAAFGKAYYDILYASYKSTSKKEEDDNGSLQSYQKAIDEFIETLG